MISFHGTCDVSRPVDETFTALADMAVLDRWNPNVTSSARVSGGQLEIGSTYESVLQRGPLRLVARSKLVAVETLRMVQYEGSIGPFWSVDRLTFEPTSTGSRVTFFNESQPPRWLRPVSPILTALFQRQASLAVDGARRHVESG